jgi:hypothetical protein
MSAAMRRERRIGDRSSARTHRIWRNVKIQRILRDTACAAPYSAVDKQCPFPRDVLKVGKIIAIPQLAGLHHRYERAAA